MRFLLAAILSLGLGYHYFLLAAGRFLGRTQPAAPEDNLLRTAILVPAHNEEASIGATVARLRGQDYPPSRYDVHVVADHCQDGTATAAAAAGAEVRERTDGPRGRKGYAVDWLVRRLLADSRDYDAIAIFDADSRVDPGFLAAATAALAAGAAVVQGQHVISNPEATIFTSLADADMRLNNLLRNQAKENLGLSARLMGDAMVFRRGILERHPWIGAESLTEDRDYGLFLVTQGVRIHYAPNARSFGQAAAAWKDATPQRLRWYGGAFDLQRRYLPRLTRQVVATGSPDALDKLLELALLPFSLLAAGSVLLWAWELALPGGRRRLRASPGAVLSVLAALFPALGLLAARAPARSFRALLVGPAYVAWRVWLAVWSRLGYRRLTWVRTRRT